jgi:hypothetical protein
MYSQPTINDFLDNIRWHLAEAIKRAQATIGGIKSDHAGRGILHSSMTYQRIFAAVNDEFETGTRAVLGELRRAVRITTLDRRTLREVTVHHGPIVAEPVPESTATKRVYGDSTL